MVSSPGNRSAPCAPGSNDGSGLPRERRRTTTAHDRDISAAGARALGDGAGCDASAQLPSAERMNFSRGDYSWEPNGEGGTLASLALDRDVAAHHLAEASTDGQPEAGAAVLARGRGLGLSEGLEQPRHLVRSHADPRVAHHEAK